MLRDNARENDNIAVRIVAEIAVCLWRYIEGKKKPPANPHTLPPRPAAPRGSILREWLNIELVRALLFSLGRVPHKDGRHRPRNHRR